MDETTRDPETADLVQVIHDLSHYNEVRYSERPFPLDFYWHWLAEAIQAFLTGLLDTTDVPDLQQESWLLNEVAFQIERDIPLSHLRSIARASGMMARERIAKGGESR